MSCITFLGKTYQYKNEVSGFELLKDSEVKNKAIALKVNNNLCDLSCVINFDARVEVITDQDKEGLDILRHDAAHIMAQAVKELFPEVQVTIGPTTEEGFYYDFMLRSGSSFSSKDLIAIEKKMQEIIKSNYRFIREVWAREDAINFFHSQSENYKVEMISSISENEKLTIYRQGSFVDLCRGPHSPSTGMVKAFKLMKVAGVYWRGDPSKPMLQRIYGTVWRDKKELVDYLSRLEEAEKRDHRKVAKDMDLFHIQDEAKGQVFWHKNGLVLYHIIESYIRKKLIKNGYTEVRTPILASRDLWEKSGHWDKFYKNMFILNKSKDQEKQMAIKPMNCPLHIQIFNQKTRSYRDLPMRIAEFGTCHRNESSGSLHGLMRVQSFVQDDAHIFCTNDQITEEIRKFCDLLKEVYDDFGFSDISIKFSDRPVIRAGSDEIWDKSEEALLRAAKDTGLDYTLSLGEGAFYGPKLEFILKDTIGRDWQCGTLQVDFVLPQRLDTFYIGQDGQKHRPVMIHRAILGTLERFIGILIEHYAGKFPLWLAPIQLTIATITHECNEYALEIEQKLKQRGVRVEVDLTNEKINYKVRLHSLKKVPILWIIGKNEVLEKEVSIRYLGKANQFSSSVNEAIQSLLELITCK